MDKMIAACGLDCLACPARIAWKTADQALREKTAAEWSALFGFAFAAEMINCSGCRAEGPKIGHCAECAMRACSSGKGYATCAECGDMASCGEIQGFFLHAPEAKGNLASIRPGR